MSAVKGSKPWNAGTSQGWTDKRGYRWLYVTENGRRVARREHRVIMEKHLGRKLEPWELVHHKDENPANNSLDNLELKEWGQHTTGHHEGGRKSHDTRKTMEAFALMREELKREREIKAELLEELKNVLSDLVYQISAKHGPEAASKYPSVVSARAAIAKATANNPTRPE